MCEYCARFEYRLCLEVKTNTSSIMLSFCLTSKSGYCLADMHPSRSFHLLGFISVRLCRLASGSGGLAVGLTGCQGALRAQIINAVCRS